MTIGRGTTTNRSKTDGTSQGFGTSRQETVGQSVSRSNSEGETENDHKKRTKSRSESDGITTSHSRSFGESNSFGTNQSETEGTGESESASLGNSRTDTSGQTDSRALGRTKSSGNSVGTSDGDSFGITSGTSDAHGGSEGVSFTETWRPVHKITEKFSGKLVTSVQDQLAFVMNQLASLPDRMVLVKCKGMGSPFLLRVHEVLDAYEERRIRESKKVPYSPAWREADLQRLLERIRTAHSYYFVPRDSDHNAKLEQLLEREIAPDEPLEKPAKKSAGIPREHRSRIHMDTPVGKKNPFEEEE